MNWGNKLLLVFFVFAAGMFYLVYRSMHVNYELVSKEYYKDELRYQDVIDARNLANTLSSKITVDLENDIILVRMPVEMKNQKVTGQIWFYCAADEKKDRHIALQLNADAEQKIRRETLLPGTYVMKFDWGSHNKHYYSEEPLTIL